MSGLCNKTRVRVGDEKSTTFSFRPNYLLSGHLQESQSFTDSVSWANSRRIGCTSRKGGGRRRKKQFRLHCCCFASLLPDVTGYRQPSVGRSPRYVTSPVRGTYLEVRPLLYEAHTRRSSCVTNKYKGFESSSEFGVGVRDPQRYGDNPRGHDLKVRGRPLESFW